MRSYLKLLAAVLSVSLIGGCAAISCPNSEGSQTSTTSSAAVISSANSETPSAPVSESEASSTPSASIPTPEGWEDFIGADGNPVTLEGATVDEDGRVTLNYGFVKILPQIYDDTFRNHALINWETMEFAEFDGSYTPEVKRLKAGDVLENGLKVKEAARMLEYIEVMDEMTFEIRREWCDTAGWVTFDGELTLDGTMYCVPEEDYQVFEGELYFFPDTTGGAQLPAQSGITPGVNRVWENVYPEADFAVRSGTIYYVGYVDEIDFDGVPGRGEAAEVTVTLGNISIQTADISRGGRGGGCFAEIIDVKPR